MRISTKGLARGVAAVTALAASAAAAGAQTPGDTRWEAWTGCWEQTVSGGTLIAGGPVVCVSATRSGSAVELATIDKGAVVARDTLDASGATRAVNKEGCVGSERGEWSADAHRVYIHSDVTCAGGVKRVSNRIASIAPTGEWLDVESVTIAGSSAVRSAHYRDVGATRTDLPAEFVAFARDRGMSVSTARTAAGSTLDIPAVAEAVKRSDSVAVQAWIAERGVRFTSLSAAQLVALSDAGVPGSVTDVMVGISYPEHFDLDRRPAGGAGIGPLSRADSARIIAAYVRDRCGIGMVSVWSSLDDPACSLALGFRGYGISSRYYDSIYGYRYGYSPYGYSAYGYGSYYSPYYSPYYGGPVVIVRGEQQQQHGQVVNGRGYRCGSCSSSGSGGTTRSTGSSGSSSSGASAASTSSGSSGSGSSSGGSSSGGSSGSSGGGRTAIPRPPM